MKDCLRTYLLLLSYPCKILKEVTVFHHKQIKKVFRNLFSGSILKISPFTLSSVLMLATITFVIN